MRFAARVLACLLVLTVLGCQSQPGADQPHGAATSAVAPPDTARAPAGWRWESYRGVEVAVPLTWGYGTTDTPWCLNVSSPKGLRPYVGRPGYVADVGCIQTGRGAPNPATRLATGGTFVWFSAEATEQVGAIPAVGDRQTRVLDGVWVQVQATQVLRRQILATVHAVRTDANGCPDRHPVDQAPGWRPAAGATVDQLTAVSAVSACRYSTGSTAGLLSSLRLVGPPAARAVAGIAAAPIGGGPDDASSCLPSSSYGEEVIVLRVSSAVGENDVVLRYSGCDHHGFDDGTTIRTLTRDAVAPFVAGPNQVTTFSGVLGGVLGR